MRVESIRTLEGQLTIQSNQFGNPGEFHSILGVGQQGPPCILPSHEPREVDSSIRVSRGYSGSELHAYRTPLASSIRGVYQPLLNCFQ